MKTNAGLWIDHREAVIVVLSETGEATSRIRSGVEKHPSHAGDHSQGKFKAHQAPSDDSRQNEFMGHLARYYDEVIASLRDAGAILLIGPGEAKEELEKRFKAHAGDHRVIALETAGQMTEQQVVARVRRHFHSEAARRD